MPSTITTLIDNYYPATIIGHCYALNDYSRIDDCWLLLRPQRLLPPSTIAPTVHRRLLAPSTIAGSIDDSCALHDYGSYRQLLPHRPLLPPSIDHCWPHRRSLPHPRLLPSTIVGHYYALDDYYPHRRLLTIAAPSTITAPHHNYCPIDHCSHHPSTITTPIGDYCHRPLLPPSMISPTIDDCWPLLRHRRLLPPSMISTTIDDCSLHRRLLPPSTIARFIHDYYPIGDYCPIDDC